MHARMNDHRLPLSAATAGVFASRARTIRLLLANDDQQFFDAFRAELDSEFEVVTTAHTTEEALQRALDHKPDVVLLGGWQPDHETTSLRLMKALSRPPKVLVLAEHECESFKSSALAAGADACLPKAELSSQGRALIRHLTLPT